MADRPAAQAGILEGDELIAVDGAPITPDVPFDDVLAMVRDSVNVLFAQEILGLGQELSLQEPLGPGEQVGGGR